jgi:hypothetical protein
MGMHLLDSSTFLIADSTFQRVGFSLVPAMNINWFLVNLLVWRGRESFLKLAGNKHSLTPSMIAVYFPESLIFGVLYIGPGPPARQIQSLNSETPSRYI